MMKRSREKAKTTKYAAMAQLVEHILGKDEVISSNLISSSNPTELVGFLVCRGYWVGVLQEDHFA